MSKQTNVPEAENHFLLLPCLCGADEAEYQASVFDPKAGPPAYWVRCCVCGRVLMPHSCAHDAQVEWNESYRRFQRERTGHE